jgi:transcriptional regulator with XRE-family HTH domain
MEIKICEMIREQRRLRGISQEKLAEACGVTVQAVSKWETQMSLPDISILPLIASFFGITMDVLFFGTERETSDLTASRSNTAETPMLFPDDGILRVVQYRGNVLLQSAELPNTPAVSLCIPETKADTPVSVEIWGNASVEGDINGSVHAGGNVECCNVNGCITAEGYISCEDVHGSATAGGNLECGDVNGSASAGKNLTCGDVGNYASSSGDLVCGDIGGDAKAGGCITSGDIGGNAEAGSDISCSDIGGNARAGNDIECSDIEGKAEAGNDISCDNIEGSATAKRDISCSNIEGNAKATSIHCDCIEGGIYSL